MKTITGRYFRTTFCIYACYVTSRMSSVRFRYPSVAIVSTSRRCTHTVVGFGRISYLYARSETGCHRSRRRKQKPIVIRGSSNGETRRIWSIIHRYRRLTATTTSLSHSVSFERHHSRLRRVYLRAAQALSLNNTRAQKESDRVRITCDHSR